MKTARAFMVAAVTLAVVAPRLASADATTDQAKTQFTLGAQAYTAGKYDVAVAAFEEAYRLLPRPEILLSLAQAEKKQCVAAKDPNLLKKALAHYRQYYAMDLPQSARKAEAVESIQMLEQLAMQPDLGGVAPTAAAQKGPTKLAVYASVEGPHVFIDGRNQGDVPFVGSVAPGKHTVVVRLAGYTDATRDVVVTEGSTQTIPMTLVERKVGVAFDTAAVPTSTSTGSSSGGPRSALRASSSCRALTWRSSCSGHRPPPWATDGEEEVKRADAVHRPSLFVTPAFPVDDAMISSAHRARRKT